MIALLADTHGSDDARLGGRAAVAVEEAERVWHLGDFTTPAVHDATDAAAGDAPLVAVHGNSDDATLRERLPATRTVEAFDRRFVLVHGHEHDRTSLSLLARQADADCVVVGHTHRGGIEEVGGLPVVNPGSHADPRGGPATHGEVRRAAGGVTVAIVSARGAQQAMASL